MRNLDDLRPSTKRTHLEIFKRNYVNREDGILRSDENTDITAVLASPRFRIKIEKLLEALNPRECDRKIVFKIDNKKIPEIKRFPFKSFDLVESLRRI